MALTHSPQKLYRYKIPFSFKDAEKETHYTALTPCVSKQGQLQQALPSPLISFRHENGFLLSPDFPDTIIKVPSCRRNTD